MVHAWLHDICPTLFSRHMLCTGHAKLPNTGTSSIRRSWLDGVVSVDKSCAHVGPGLEPKSGNTYDAHDWQRKNAWKIL
eukprot:3303792-Amphidinium_carterae.1